ncbi:MAG: hypothetical protein N2554_06695 [Fimbriimonadales bacterium]|nr:hypothetical protein [Fimbriimonadales bacterium]
MESSHDWLLPTLAICQIPIMVGLWLAARRTTLSAAAKRACYFGVLMSGIVFAMQMSLWLATLSPPNEFLKAVQSGLIVGMGLLVVIALVGGLVLVLTGALRAEEPHPPRE